MITSKRSMCILVLVCVLCLPTFLSATEKEFSITATARNLKNVYWVEWNEGGKEAAEALGVNYKFISGEDNEAKQLSAVETAIAAGTDAIVFQPVSDAVVTAAIELCEENKVPIVTMWDKPQALDINDHEYWIAHVTQDSVVQGYTIAKKLFEALGGKGNVVGVGGISGTQCAEDRKKGLEMALEEFPDIKLLGFQAGDYSRFAAMPIMEDFITAHGDKIQGVWSCNDDTALGVIEALKGAQMTGVKVVGVDATKENVQAIMNGDMYLTLGGDGGGMHGMGILAAFDYLNGFPPKEKVLFWEPPIVGPDSAEDYFNKMFVPENYKPHPWKEWSQYYSSQK